MAIVDEGKPHKIGNVYLDGVVYLIHFDRPYKQSSHYLGWTHDLEKRLARHRAGHGSNILKVIQNAGIGWQVVRVWEPASPKVESELKKYRNNKRLCPICSKQLAYDRAEHMRNARKQAKLLTSKQRYEQEVLKGDEDVE